MLSRVRNSFPLATLQNVSRLQVLDVVFGEDDSRVRVGHAAENFALVRRMANNLLQQERTLTRGVKTKRLKAALDERYLLKVLQT